ncbi:MAG: tetraacyldisaccharide 4'-kinase [Bacteroides sp.]|nr:tetraacyldisaccharide 4'-kinase [Bacteroides sp.]MCI1684109.1 tetraacyldisaccharide 4'-kinase [Bacteroides sp.]
MTNKLIRLIQYGLYPISWLYGIGVGFRNKLFDWGYLRSKSFSIPVICIGNLAVGGTGKTPHTEYLIRLLQKNNFNIAILSRGYKRISKGYVLATPRSDVQTLGDEPYQMKTKYPDIRVAVDEDRCQGIEHLMQLKNPAVDVILLDDAFQHRYVKAGLNILLTDYHRLYCDDKLLPAGRLRENEKGKERAHIVIVTKCPEDIKPIDYNIIGKRLNLYPYQKLFFSCLQYGMLIPLFPETGSKERTLNSLKEEDILLMTGIASPAPLKKKIKEYTDHVTSLSFGDHHNFTSTDIRQIKEQFGKLKGENRLIITTEKDGTRLIHHPSIDESLKPFIYTLPIEIRILQNQQNIFNQNIIDYVRTYSRNSSLPQK